MNNVVEVEAMMVSRTQSGGIQLELADWRNRYCFTLTEGQARSLIYAMQDRLNTQPAAQPATATEGSV